MLLEETANLRLQGWKVTSLGWEDLVCVCIGLSIHLLLDIYVAGLGCGMPFGKNLLHFKCTALLFNFAHFVFAAISNATVQPTYKCHGFCSSDCAYSVITGARIDTTWRHSRTIESCNSMNWELIWYVNFVKRFWRSHSEILHCDVESRQHILGNYCISVSCIRGTGNAMKV